LNSWREWSTGSFAQSERDAGCSSVYRVTLENDDKTRASTHVMNPQRKILIGLALILVPVIAWILFPRRNETTEPPSKAAASRQETNRLQESGAPARPASQNKTGPQTQQPGATEPAQPRVEAVETRRSQQTTTAKGASQPGATSPEKMTAAGGAPIASGGKAPQTTTPEEATPSSVAATVRMAFEETVVTGGWTSEAGKRAFVLVTPKLDADGDIRLDTKLVILPADQAASLKLGSQHYGVMNSEAAKSFAADLSRRPGAEVVYGPVVMTRPEVQADIQLLPKSADSAGNVSVSFMALPQPGGQNLDLQIKVSRP
jgi:cytoskeletal protein RodZ